MAHATRTREMDGYLVRGPGFSDHYEGEFAAESERMRSMLSIEATSYANVTPAPCGASGSTFTRREAAPWDAGMTGPCVTESRAAR